MRYLSEGMIHSVDSPQELVRELHKVSHAPAADDLTWMLETADRTELQSGHKVRTNTPENFIADLLKFGLIERLEK